MNSADTIRTLNRLVVLHNRSLATYLSYASPTWHLGDEAAQQVLNLIASQQRGIVDGLGSWILDHGGTVDNGHYPMTFTGYHDLSFVFLLGKLIESEERIINNLASSVEQIDDLRAREKVQQALGAAKGHLESLSELPTTSTST